MWIGNAWGKDRWRNIQIGMHDLSALLSYISKVVVSFWSKRVLSGFLRNDSQVSVCPSQSPSYSSHSNSLSVIPSGGPCWWARDEERGRASLEDRSSSNLNQNRYDLRPGPLQRPPLSHPYWPLTPSVFSWINPNPNPHPLVAWAGWLLKEQTQLS